MGVVCRAEDTTLRRTVALKLLPESMAHTGKFCERLKREASLNSLEKAVSKGTTPETIRDTPNFSSLSDNPRFLVLIQGDPGQTH